MTVALEIECPTNILNIRWPLVWDDWNITGHPYWTVCLVMGVNLHITYIPHKIWFLYIVLQRCIYKINFLLIFANIHLNNLFYILKTWICDICMYTLARDAYYNFGLLRNAFKLCNDIFKKKEQYVQIFIGWSNVSMVTSISK